MFQSNIFDIQPDDIKIEILSQFTYPDLLVFIKNNKDYEHICNKNELWNKLIERDFNFYPSDGLYAKESYEHWYKYFNEYVLKIIGSFIIYRTGYNDLQQVYEKIFHLLVEYVIENNNAFDRESEEEIDSYLSSTQYRIYHEIFETLSIPINKDIGLVKLIPRSFMIDPADDKSRYAKLLDIIGGMMMSYHDPILNVD